jgi:hypothetical protein
MAIKKSKATSLTKRRRENLLVEDRPLLSLSVEGHFTISCDANTFPESFFQLFDPVFFLIQTPRPLTFQQSGLVSYVAQLFRQSIDGKLFDADHFLQLLNDVFQLILPLRQPILSLLHQSIRRIPLVALFRRLGRRHFQDTNQNDENSTKRNWIPTE